MVRVGHGQLPGAGTGLQGRQSAAATVPALASRPGRGATGQAALCPQRPVPPPLGGTEPPALLRPLGWCPGSSAFPPSPPHWVSPRLPLRSQFAIGQVPPLQPCSGQVFPPRDGVGCVFLPFPFVGFRENGLGRGRGTGTGRGEERHGGAFRSPRGVRWAAPSRGMLGAVVLSAAPFPGWWGWRPCWLLQALAGAAPLCVAQGTVRARVSAVSTLAAPGCSCPREQGSIQPRHLAGPCA